MGVVSVRALGSHREVALDDLRSLLTVGVISTCAKPLICIGSWLATAVASTIEGNIGNRGILYVRGSKEVWNCAYVDS